MILLWGVEEDPPLAAVRAALDAASAPYVFLDQREPPPAHAFAFGARLGGRIGILDLSEVRGAYIRPMDYGELPEHTDSVKGRRGLPALRRFAHSLTDWLELADALVVNRLSAQASNTSKLFQARMIAAAGFAVPPSLATTDPRAVRTLLQRHGDVVYKSLSSVRSIVHRVGTDQLARLRFVEHCPTLFQERIEGLDHRVHVIGGRAIATLLASDEDDYRYDHHAERIRVELPAGVVSRCIALSAALDLPVSGIDLRRARDGRWVCFEVNPSPAFPYFEEPGTNAIAEAIAALLIGAGSPRASLPAGG